MENTNTPNDPALLREALREALRIMAHDDTWTIRPEHQGTADRLHAFLRGDMADWRDLRAAAEES